MLYDLAPIEFDIIKLLWEFRELSSREIHEKTEKQTGWKYSTTRTVITRMEKKGYITRENFHGINVYSAGLSKVKVMAQHMTRFAEKILESDAIVLLPLFAKSEVLSPEELENLKALLKSKGGKK